MPCNLLEFRWFYSGLNILPRDFYIARLPDNLYFILGSLAETSIGNQANTRPPVKIEKTLENYSIPGKALEST